MLDPALDRELDEALDRGLDPIDQATFPTMIGAAAHFRCKGHGHSLPSRILEVPMIANLLLTVYNYLRFCWLATLLFPPKPIDLLARQLGWNGRRKARLLADGVRGYCAKDPEAMGYCARELDKLGGICGFDDAPNLALLLSRTVMIATNQFTPSGGIPHELSELLRCVRLVLPPEHIVPIETSSKLRIGLVK